MRTYRTYTPEQRQQAVARAVIVGSKQAARELGYPWRTVSSWVAGETRARELMPIVSATREQMAEQLWATIEQGVAVLSAKLSDPKARLNDVARALEVSLNAHSLLVGRPTAITENVNVNVEPSWSIAAEQERAAAAFVDDLLSKSDADLAEWLASGGLGFLRQINADADRMHAELTAGQEPTDA